MPLKLKTKLHVLYIVHVYTTVIKKASLYGLEVMPLKKKHEAFGSNRNENAEAASTFLSTSAKFTGMFDSSGGSGT